MSFQDMQMTEIKRYHNGIRAYEIVDITADNLVVKRANGKLCGILVDDTDGYSIGQYVDAIIIDQSKTCYSVQLIGHTPDKFIPKKDQNG